MDRPGTVIPHEGWTPLHNLAAASSMLACAEDDAMRLRKIRNGRILTALEAGFTEADVAKVAGVSGSYVHRVKQYDGEPPSGPTMDAERRRR